MRSGFCNFMHIKTISADVKKRLRERRRRFVFCSGDLKKYFIDFRSRSRSQSPSRKNRRR